MYLAFQICNNFPCSLFIYDFILPCEYLGCTCDPFHQVHDVGIWKPVTWCPAQPNFCRNICQQQTCHIFITTRRWDSKRAWWNCVLWYVGLFNVIICNVCIHSEHVMYTYRRIIRVEHDWTEVLICKDLVDFGQSAQIMQKSAWKLASSFHVEAGVWRLTLKYWPLKEKSMSKWMSHRAFKHPKFAK